jgi:hypothetical protein
MEVRDRRWDEDELVRGDSLFGLTMPPERDDFFLLKTLGAGFEIESMERAEDEEPEPPRSFVAEPLEEMVLEEAHE